MREVVFNKETACPWSEKQVEVVVGKINKKVKLNGGLEINVIGAAAMRKLNKTTRGIDKVTDVLSFAWREEKTMAGSFLGQIYICYPRIVSQARDFGVSAKEEFVRILAHGVLHLMGYDHGRQKDAQRMFKIQEEIVQEV